LRTGGRRRLRAPGCRIIDGGDGGRYVRRPGRRHLYILKLAQTGRRGRAVNRDSAHGRPIFPLPKKKAGVDADPPVLYQNRMKRAFPSLMTITLSRGVAADTRGMRVR